MISRYFATVKISAKQRVSGGVLYLYLSYLIRLILLLVLICFWTVLFNNHTQSGMTLRQMLTYTCLSNLLGELLNVQTPATSWLGGDFFINACKRPTSILGDFTAQTVGGWLQMLLLFSLPMIMVLPLFGISMIPVSMWWFPSLLLTISLGFCIDYLFACLILRLRNAVWLAHTIRNAITGMFSGAFIPFALLPWGMGNVLKWLPFGSLAGAPLSIFVGTGNPAELIPVQIVWNLMLWPLTILYFYKSRERMVSYGG